MELAHLKKIFLSTFLLLLTISCALSTPTTRLLEGVYFTDQGGYEIQLVKDYTLNEFSGGFEMLTPGSSILVGPGFLVYGGLIEEERTNEELWNLITQEEYKNFQFEEPKARKIDSISGFIGEFQGVQANKNIRGKLFLTMVGQKQQFIMLGFAPEDEWRKFESLFDTILKTVKFFIPNRVLKLDNPYKRHIDENEFQKSPIPESSSDSEN